MANPPPPYQFSTINSACAYYSYVTQ